MWAKQAALTYRLHRLDNSACPPFLARLSSAFDKGFLPVYAASPDTDFLDKHLKVPRLGRSAGRGFHQSRDLFAVLVLLHALHVRGARTKPGHHAPAACEIPPGSSLRQHTPEVKGLSSWICSHEFYLLGLLNLPWSTLKLFEGLQHVPSVAAREGAQAATNAAAHHPCGRKQPNVSSFIVLYQKMLVCTRLVQEGGPKTRRSPGRSSPQERAL